MSIYLFMRDEFSASGLTYRPSSPIRPSLLISLGECTIERDFEVRACSTKSKTYWHRTKPCLLSLLHDTEWSIASPNSTRAIQADMNGRSKEERQSRGNLWKIVQCTSRDVHVTRHPRCYAYVWRSDWNALIYVGHGGQCLAWTFACCFLGGLFVFC